MWTSSERSTAIYGISDKARCIAAQAGERQKNCFMVGTLTLRDRNQIHHIEVSEDVTEVIRVGLYDHPLEIWYLTCCPWDKNLLFTVYNTVPAFKASLWRMDEEGVLEEMVQLGAHTGVIKCILWQPGEDSSRTVASLDEHNIRVWDLSTSQEQSCLNIGELSILTTGCWNPYLENQITTATGSGVTGYDLREKSKIFSIARAHGPFVRDIDINPNKPYYFATGGDDCKVKFWDQRKLEKPLKVLSKHAHWVWKVQYNPRFDALMVSASTDGTVNLWNVGSLSFQNPNVLYENTLADNADKLVKTYDDHEDSIYSACWSLCDDRPWDWASFASLSYDGRVVINRVPEKEARKVLGA